MKSKNSFKKYLEKVKKKVRKNETVYSNKYPIDKYIDDYWFLNCPDSLNVATVNEKVYRLIHEVMMYDFDFIQSKTNENVQISPKEP
jgi:hypothetical protein